MRVCEGVLHKYCYLSSKQTDELQHPSVPVTTAMFSHNDSLQLCHGITAYYILISIIYWELLLHSRDVTFDDNSSLNFPL